MGLHNDVQSCEASGRWYDMSRGFTKQLIFVHKLEVNIGVGNVIVEGFSGEGVHMIRTGKMKLPYRTDFFCGVEGCLNIPQTHDVPGQYIEAVRTH